MDGYSGLWQLGSKANRLALTWKYLEDLKDRKCGTPEVEMSAWKMTINRAVRLGNERSRLKKGHYDSRITRDQIKIEKDMEHRVILAKADWIQARKELLKYISLLEKGATS